MEFLHFNIFITRETWNSSASFADYFGHRMY